jgi:hypothetical protein
LIILRKYDLCFLIFGSSLSLRYVFWSAMGLSRRNRGEVLRWSGIAPPEKVYWRRLGTLVDSRARLLARVLGNMEDRVESA